MTTLSNFDIGDHYRHSFRSFRKSYVLVSPLKAVHCAIVFVHGYGGDSHGTWTNFQMLIDNSQDTAISFRDCDLYFFQYESKDEWIHASTDRLLNFLEQLILDPKDVHFTEDVGPVQVPPQPPAEGGSQIVSVLPAPRRYTHLILVGHSEGGAVIRNAVIKHFNRKSLKRSYRIRWKILMGSRISLFAPAIAGFRPTGFLGILMKMPWLGNTLDAILHKDAGYQDLSSGDFLKDLKEQTEAAASKYPHKALRADIVWGYADKVVHPTKYAEDTEEFVEADHRGICKPRENYLHPLKFVSRGLDENELEPPGTEGDLLERSEAK